MTDVNVCDERVSIQDAHRIMGSRFLGVEVAPGRAIGFASSTLESAYRDGFFLLFVQGESVNELMYGEVSRFGGLTAYRDVGFMRDRPNPGWYLCKLDSWNRSPLTVPSLRLMEVSIIVLAYHTGIRDFVTIPERMVSGSSMGILPQYTNAPPVVIVRYHEGAYQIEQSSRHNVPYDVPALWGAKETYRTGNV